MKYNRSRAFRFMEKTKVYRWIFWGLIFIWSTLLMWLSSENGMATNQTSMRLAAMIVQWFGIAAEQVPAVNRLLRTLAHFVVFFILGGAVYCVAWVTQPYQKGAALPSFVICMILAVIDEAKKIFITGRHLSWEEMGLNCIGAAVGIYLTLCCIWISTRWVKTMYCLRPIKPELL